MTTPETCHDIDALAELFKTLGLKTPVDQVPAELRHMLPDFLRREAQLRHQLKIQRLLKLSGLGPAQVKTFDAFDWAFNPKLPRHDLLAFRHSAWIDEAHNLTLIGDAGLGKSHLARALCYEAILKGHSAAFISAFDLVSKLKRASNLASRVDYYGASVRVLALDELGYAYHAKEDADLLFQIVSKRSESLPTIVTTNLAPKQWGSLFSGPAASAILDRLSFNGKFITLEGQSYRLRSRKK